MRILLILLTLAGTPALAQTVQKPPTPVEIQAAFAAMHVQLEDALNQNIALSVQIADLKAQLAEAQDQVKTLTTKTAKK